MIHACSKCTSHTLLVVPLHPCSLCRHTTAAAATPVRL
jgi:hypothetical protein